MSEFEGFDARDELIVSEAQKRGLTRDEAIAYGRKLAEDENAKLKARGFGSDPEGRIARAEAYAAWEYDGRQAGTIGRIVSPSPLPPPPDLTPGAKDDVTPYFKPDPKPERKK